MASPESQDIVQLLAQHKNENALGHKILFSVQIIWNTEANKAGLQWTIADFNNAITNMMNTEEAGWLPIHLQQRHLQGSTGNINAGPGAVGVAGPAGGPLSRISPSQLAPNWNPAPLLQEYGYPNYF